MCNSSNNVELHSIHYILQIKYKHKHNGKKKKPQWFHIVWSRMYDFTVKIQDTYCLIKVMLIKVHFLFEYKVWVKFDPALIKVGAQVLHFLHFSCTYGKNKQTKKHYTNPCTHDKHKHPCFTVPLFCVMFFSELCTNTSWTNFTCTSLPEGFCSLA